MEPEKSSLRMWTRLKIFLGIELVLGLIALVVPITPSKTGAPFAWPPSLASYFEEVLFGFLMVNGIVLVLALVVWIYWVVRGRPGWTEEGSEEQR